MVLTPAAVLAELAMVLATGQIPMVLTLSFLTPCFFVFRLQSVRA